MKTALRIVMAVTGFVALAPFAVRAQVGATDYTKATTSVQKLRGNLTLLGVTKPLTLKIERWVCKDNPMNKKPMCGGNATASLKRSDFGMKYGLPAIGDDLKLSFEFEGYKD